MPPDAEYPLLTHVDSLMDELRTNVPKALKEWDEDGIHDARVATRRLKAVLDLVEPVTSGKTRKPYGKVLRRIRRRLGPLRDADVLIGHLKGFGRSKKVAPAVQWLKAHISEEREHAREGIRDDGPPARTLEKLGSYWAFRDELAELGSDAADNLLAQSLHLQLDSFIEQSGRVIDDLRQRALEASGAETGTAPDAEVPPSAESHPDPHELRIAGKILRYTLEMAAVQGHKLPKSVMKQFKAMQEALGEWHDYVVLADRALQAAVNKLLSHHQPALMERVLDLSRTALRKATQQLDGFAKLWMREGDELGRIIRETFPLTRPAEPPPALETEEAPPEARDGQAVEAEASAGMTG